MALSDTQIRAAKPAEKPYKLPDGGGLYLLIQPSGSKLWRQKFRYMGKEKLLAHGAYPDVSLKDARERRDAARKLLAADIDPSEARKAHKAEKELRAVNSFEAVAREWFDKMSGKWADSHAGKVIARLENDLFPWIGSRPIAELSPPEILACVRRVEQRGAIDTAHRALQNLGQVLRYGVATGRCQRDVSVDLRGALPPARPGHFAAVTEPMKVGALLRKVFDIKATLPVYCAVRLLPYLFVRPGELRLMRWTEIDFDRSEWRYTVSKTKTEHLVPLPKQAIEILREIQPLSGRGEYVFPGARTNGEAMSGNALNVALRRAGINTRKEQTGHGFRAVARTLLHQELGFAPEVIEHQLAHRVPDTLGAAYNRTKFIEQRRVMMQQWAEYLDRLRDGADVVPLRQVA